MCRTISKARILLVYILLPTSSFMWSFSSCYACWWKSKGQVYGVFTTQQCIFSVDTESPQVSGVRERSLFSSLARPQASTSHLVLNGSAALLCVSPRKYSSVYKNWKKKSELCLTPALGRRINSLIRNKLRIGSRDSIIRSATDLLWPWGSHWTLRFPLV